MDILTHTNWVDVLVLIIVLRTSYVAFQEGLSHEIFPLIGNLVIVVASLHYYAKLGSFFSENLVKMPPSIADFLSFLILVIGIGLLFRVIKVLLDMIIKVEWHPLLERLGGMVFGVARAFIAASLVLMILALVPLPYLQRSIRDRSLTGPYVLGVGPYIYEKAYAALPFLRKEGPPVTRDEIIKRLESDKSLPSGEIKKEGVSTPEWEKVTRI